MKIGHTMKRDNKNNIFKVLKKKKSENHFGTSIHPFREYASLYK